MYKQALNVFTDIVKNDAPKIAEHLIKGNREGTVQEVGRVLEQKVLSRVMPPQIIPFVSAPLLSKASEKIPSLLHKTADTFVAKIENSQIETHVPQSTGNGLLNLATTAAGLALKTALHPAAGFTSLLSIGLGNLVTGEFSTLGSLVTQGFSMLGTQLTEIGEGINRLEIGQQQIAKSLAEGFASVEKLVQYNSQLLDRVLDQQKTFYEDLKEEHARTRKEIHAHLNETQEKILKAIDAEGIRGLKDKLNMLFVEYKAFSVTLQKKKPFVPRDLEKLEETAKELMGMFETRYQDQSLGNPARLPFFLGIAFCLGIWCDARSALGDSLDHCCVRAHTLIDNINAELRTFTQNASLYALAVGETDVINQYVALLQSLRALSSLSRSKADEVVLLALPGWDDGLQQVRKLVCASQNKGQRAPMPTLTLDNAEEREGWRKIAKLPRTYHVDKVSGEKFHRVLGVPDDVSLSPAEAKQLLHAIPAVLEQYSQNVKKQISAT